METKYQYRIVFKDGNHYTRFNGSLYKDKESIEISVRSLRKTHRLDFEIECREASYSKWSLYDYNSTTAQNPPEKE